MHRKEIKIMPLEKNRLIQGSQSLTNGTQSSLNLSDDGRDTDMKNESEHKQISSFELDNDKEKENEESSAFKFSALSTTKKYTLLMFISANMSHMMAYSMMGPFFPTEAKRKGITQTEVGLIFSVCEFIIFMFCPVFGCYLTSIGPKFMFNTGIVVAGSCSILFGFLAYSPGGLPFLVLCFLTRILEALGIAAYVTSCYAIAACEFKSHISTIVGILETATSIGFMIGPTIGGFLYEAGGFGLPFYVIGCFILLNGILIFAILPDSIDCTPRKKPAWSLFKSGQIKISCLSMMVVAFGCTSLYPNMAIKIEQMGIPSEYTGLIFIIWPFAYVLVTPLWGWMTDVKCIEAHLLVFGNLICGLVFLVMGPSPLLPFVPRLQWLFLADLVLYGLFIGAPLLPNMKCMVEGAESIGFDSSLDTFGLVAGILRGSYSFGSSVGPFVAGMLQQNFGFPMAVTSSGLLFLLASIVNFAYFFVYRRYSKSNNSNNNSSSSHAQVIDSNYSRTIISTKSCHNDRLSQDQMDNQSPIIAMDKKKNYLALGVNSNNGAAIQTEITP